MRKILTLTILLTIGTFGTSSISANTNPTQFHLANSTETSFLNEQSNRWNRNQQRRVNRNQKKHVKRHQNRWNRHQPNRWNRNQNRWNRNQNRNRYNPRMQRGVRTVNRSHIIRRGGHNYRQTTQYRYLPNGRTQTRVLNLVRIW